MRVRLAVSGRVQGVGFRWFVREAARRRRLAGWVRNRPDGSVELEVSGDDGAVREFLETVREGPSGARVDDVEEIISSNPDALPQPFTIIR
ncbi:MAG TPA: acylphosphatase [Gemmatimonadaceae bacterium]|nr:acylphosphatase [Gemmatimonadaceae bacterium]